MTDPFDFAALEAHLVAGCHRATAAYAGVAQAGDPAVFFALDCNPYHGEFLPSFDTQENALTCVAATQRDKLARRDWMNDTSPDAWRRAHLFATHGSLLPFNEEVSEFSHHMIVDLAYDVAPLTQGPRYAELNANADKDGWIEGHCRAVLARVCDRLVDDNAFDGIAIARPFGVGYQYHGEPMIVCRLLL